MKGGGAGDAGIKGLGQEPQLLGDPDARAESGRARRGPAVSQTGRNAYLGSA